MKLYVVALMLFALVACDNAPPVAPAPQRSALDAPPEIPVMGRELRVLALGDSLLAGYGLAQGQGYPERLETALRARGLNVRVANAGVSGDTSAAGLQRLAFTLDSQAGPPELVLISLGGNDMLRGLSPEQTRANLDAILTELKRRGIKALLLGMLAAPNMGKDYAAAFNPIYPALARKHGAALVPFFLTPLVDHPELVQDDKVHPNAEGVEAMVVATIDTVADALPAP